MGSLGSNNLLILPNCVETNEMFEMSVVVVVVEVMVVVAVIVVVVGVIVVVVE